MEMGVVVCWRLLVSSEENVDEPTLVAIVVVAADVVGNGVNVSTPTSVVVDDDGDASVQFSGLSDVHMQMAGFAGAEQFRHVKRESQSMSFVNVDNGGIVPVSALLYQRTRCSDVIRPISVGIVPVRRVSCKYQNKSDRRLPTSLGIVPDNLKFSCT
jgi:hypothetical protein